MITEKYKLAKVANGCDVPCYQHLSLIKINHVPNNAKTGFAI